MTQEIRLDRIVNGEDEFIVIEDEADSVEIYMQAVHLLWTIMPVSVPAPVVPVANQESFRLRLISH